MRQFPASPITALIDEKPRYNLGESVAPDLTVAELLGSAGLADLADVKLGYGTSAGGAGGGAPGGRRRSGARRHGGDRGVVVRGRLPHRPRRVRRQAVLPDAARQRRVAAEPVRRRVQAR